MSEDCSLQKNMNALGQEVNEYFDEVIGCVEERRKALLRKIAEIRTRSLSSDVDRNGQCFWFSGTDDIFGQLRSLGSINDNKACASLSLASGFGLRYGICKETNSFVLQTCNKYGEGSWTEKDTVAVAVKLDADSHKCIVKNRCNGVYDVTFEVSESGCFEIEVKVNGEHIAHSPFRCCVFEKHDLKFRVEDNPPELLIQTNEKMALLEKACRSSRLYSNMGALARAWKVRVTTACAEIKLKFGYCYDSVVTHLQEEFVCKFDLKELEMVKSQAPIVGPQKLHHHHHHHHHHRKPLRKQSSFQCTSLTFVVIEDITENRIHVALENTNTEKMTSFNSEDSQNLIPFIGVKHFCKNTACPRPTIVFL